MFETEVQHEQLGRGVLPEHILTQFLDKPDLTHLSQINWEEHCTECAYPACYSTCDLYNPRNDGNCRRTLDGFAPVSKVTMFGDPLVRVRFRRWGAITGHCNLLLSPISRVERMQRRINVLSEIAARFPNFGKSVGRPGLPSRLVRRLKIRNAEIAVPAEQAALPTAFLMEVYNPGSEVSLSFDIGAVGEQAPRIPFKTLLTVPPGFQRIRIDFELIAPHIGGAERVFCGLNPNLQAPEEEGLTLFLGTMGLVRETRQPSSDLNRSTKKIKVAIWDLDNTVWDGTLIEEGPGRVQLRAGVRETIAELDRRGIVNSVASKNHDAMALAELDRLGIRKYFIFPQIGWSPKGKAVRLIRESFNVGEDTLAFIDDQPFEREEVASVNPRVRCYSHDDVQRLLERDEFTVPVTAEAGQRRAYYEAEVERKSALADSDSDYLEFLRRSSIVAKIEIASVRQIDRIHELVQRTNQMNFSGTRYSRGDLEELLTRSDRNCFVVEVEDKFGKYGQVGFAVVHPGDTPRVLDLAFSCRVQAKRVEHAVLVFLMDRYARLGRQQFEVSCRPNDRNRPAMQVFLDLEFEEVGMIGDATLFRRSLPAGPDTPVVQVEFIRGADVHSSEQWAALS